ncbi:hypothetical protein BpHYR1_041594 [Brachionus plicatilis]|uniref:Uncharacterized protein n=1 Tax=Brachionus plicatilis TaxID=10195 RepID=A0A3M7SRF7_BRAPC|nr:hypothetical protein BpHYR1_041594 [Brachionus plicatilis]
MPDEDEPVLTNLNIVFDVLPTLDVYLDPMFTRLVDLLVLLEPVDLLPDLKPDRIPDVRRQLHTKNKNKFFILF